MLRLDDDTKEAVAAYILFRRLEFPIDRIAIQDAHVNGSPAAAIICIKDRNAIPVVIGPLVNVNFNLLKGRWKEACKTVEMIWGVDSLQTQNLLEGTRVAKNASKVCEALIAQGMLDPDYEMTEKLYKKQIVESLGTDLVSFPLIKTDPPEKKD